MTWKDEDESCPNQECRSASTSCEDKGDHKECVCHRCGEKFEILQIRRS